MKFVYLKYKIIYSWDEKNKTQNIETLMIFVILWNSNFLLQTIWNNNSIRILYSNWFVNIKHSLVGIIFL